MTLEEKMFAWLDMKRAKLDEIIIDASCQTFVCTVDMTKDYTAQNNSAFYQAGAHHRARIEAAQWQVLVGSV